MYDDELKKIIELASYPNPPSVDKEENNKFYEDAFNKIAAGKIITWNWAAFFFGSLWAFYRKMYCAAFFILVFYTTLVLNGGIIAWIVGSVAGGMLYNYFYYKDLQRKVRLGYNLIHHKPTDSIAAWVGTLFWPLDLLYCLGRWISSRRQIAAIKKQIAVNPSGVVTK
jgi:hypothetical protein